MTKKQFDQFQNKILELSGNAEVFWEEIKALQTTKEKAIRLLRKKNYQLAVRNNELQKAKNEIRNFKSHLQEAIKQIRHLERERSQTTPPQQNIKDAYSGAIDLKKIANDFDAKLARKEEEKTLNYLKNW